METMRELKVVATEDDDQKLIFIETVYLTQSNAESITQSYRKWWSLVTFYVFVVF